MMEKTSGDDYLQKTNKTISRFLIVVIFTAVFFSFAVPAEATHQGTNVVIFTDKKAYNPFNIDLGQNGGPPAYKSDLTADFSIYVYAMVLDERGLIMKGREGLLTGTLVDQKEYRHTNASNHIGAIINNPGIVGSKTLSFVDDGSVNGDIAGDGIYTAVVDMPENIGTSMAAVTDELLINITVTDPQAGSGYTDVLVAGFNCMQPKTDYGSAFNAHVSTGTPPKSDNCVVCHRAYEHFFENISGAIDYKYLDVHFKNATARSRVQDPLHDVVKSAKTFDVSFRWNMSDYKVVSYPASTRTLEDMAPGSSFCYFCHTYNLTAQIMKYGNQRADLTDIPSCNNSNCHTTTKIGGNAVPSWSPASAAAIASPSMGSPNYNISQAQQHAHDDTGGNTVPCATCHGTAHSLQIPNGTSTDYTDLANRCLSCHTLFNKHNNSVSCIKCHSNDVHNIRFLQEDLSYNWSRSNIVECDNCHSNASFGTALGLNPPQVPLTNHSTDSDAGQKWGDYWTSKNQLDAVGGSNLIQTQTVAVSLSSSVIGSNTSVSGAKTVDGSYQTLTEGWANTIDDYTPVDSSTSSVWGTVSNLANAQSASDSNAYATFMEEATGSGTNVNYFGSVVGNHADTLNPYNAADIDGAYATIGVTGGSPHYVTVGGFSGLNGAGAITSVVVYARAIRSGNKDSGFKLTGNSLTGDSGTLTSTATITNFTWDISGQISNWDQLANLEITATRVGNVADIDAVWISVSYSDIKIMDITTTISSTTASDLYYIELNYYTSGDTFDIFAYNGTGWVDKGDLTQTGSFTVFNTSLTPAEYNGGSPQIRFKDKTASATTGYLYVEYERVHSYTGGSSAASNHYELKHNHNFTGVPKYAASEVAEYTLAVKGYVTAGENMHIYAYDYSSDSYSLIKDSAFPTSNGWVNYTIPYAAISDTGEANIQFRDANKSRDDDTASNFYLDYVAIKADNNRFLPCFYCHALLANHKKRALGNIEWIQGGFDTNNPMNSTDLGNTYWCANCHYNGSTPSGRYKYNGTAWSPVPPRIDYNNVANNSGSWFDHSATVASNFTDAKCKTCHGTEAIVTTKDAPHTVQVGTGGGNNCLECHNLETGLSGGAPVGINFTAANLSVHYGMNSLNATNAGFAPVIGACWACHATDGNVSSGHPDLYKTPKTCTDCHLASGTYNSQTQGWGGLTVSEHYYSGSDISAGNSSSDIASCINCHENVTEMIIYNNDTDTSSFTGDGVRLTGGNLSYYHYGNSKVWTPDTNAYCNNCHNNASTAFPFGNEANKTIANHSSNYPASNPDCKDCHSTGKIHNSTLGKPALTLQNSSFCLTCHGSGGSATRNNFERHNGASGLNCTQCHLNSTGSIHPVRYLQQDGSSWTTTNTSAVNCTTCHQNSGLGGDFAAAPIVPTPVNHSTNTYSGALWKGSQSAYWDNTSQQSTCDFCHSNSALHNSSGLGRVPAGNNTKNSSLTGSYWCANCHYSATSNYSISQFGSQPPEVTNSSALVPATASDGTPFKNHSTDLASQSDDNKCSGCHDNGATNTLEFAHNVGAGGGGPDCISCHDAGNSPPTTGALINFTAMNSTGSIHKDLNKDASTALSAQNKKCWACHGDGTEPSGHPDRYKTPYTCVDCHEPDGDQNFNYTPNNTILNVTQHFWNGTSINTAAVTSSCYDCHNKTEMMLGTNLDPDGAGTGVNSGANGGNGSVSHYGKKRTDYPTEGTNAYCNQCHNNGSTVFPFADNNNKTIANHSSNYPATNPDCDDCHSTGRIHNSSLNKPSDPVGNGTFCLSCHGNDGAGATNFSGAVTTYKEEHNSSKCTECHLNSSRSIHTVRYLQQDGSTWTTTNTSAVNCTTCHQGTGIGGDFASAPIMPTPIWHSNSSYNGSRWNGAQSAFWDNTSLQTSCDYCHGDVAIHNSSGLGNITLIQGGNQKNQSISSTSYWCANCHYDGQSATGNYDYNGNLFSPVPPEIINKTGLVPANASNGMPFQNHTLNVGSDWSDSRCKTCHASDATTTGMFAHKLNESQPEAGGKDCLGCHDINSNDPNGPPSNRKVNGTAFSNYSVHKNLNSGTVPSQSMSFNNASVACWACHSDGTEPIKHPADYINPRACEDCHVDNAFSAPLVYKHYPGSVFSGIKVYNSTDPDMTCSSCHNNSIVDNLGLSIDSYDAVKLKNATASHYSVNRSFGENNPFIVNGALPNTTQMLGCKECHATDGGGQYGNSYGKARSMPTGHSNMGSTPQPCGRACHNTQPVAVNLHNQSVGIYVSSQTCYSTGCHSLPSQGGVGKKKR